MADFKSQIMRMNAALSIIVYNPWNICYTLCIICLINSKSPGNRYAQPGTEIVYFGPAHVKENSSFPFELLVFSSSCHRTSFV